MQDTFPFVDSLTIPVDAGTGSRVFIGTINDEGVIQIYDTNNNLVGEWNADQLRVIEPDSGDEVKLDPAIMPFGIATNHAAILFNDDIIYRGNLNNLLVVSNITDGVSRLVQEGPAGNFEGVPRGLIKSTGRLDNTPAVQSSSTLIPNLNVVNVPVVADETYHVHVHSQIALSAGGGAWAIELYINNVIYDTFDIFNVAGTRMLDGWLPWTPTVTQSTDDLAVFANELVGGSTIQSQANATVTRFLEVVNVSSEV